jgi:peptidoglycan hydrolase CwlO-like protein
MSEIREQIASLRRQIAAVAEQTLDAQALLQRLHAERSTLESELRGLEAARRARLSLAKNRGRGANDNGHHD